MARAKSLHVGATPQWMLLRQHLRAEDEHEADDDQQRLRGEVDDRQEDVEARGLLDADDVDGDEQDDDDCAADDVPRVLAQRLPEDREVVGTKKAEMATVAT